MKNSREGGSMSLRIGVIFGGRSTEHEVSIVSARNVGKTLVAAGYTAVPVAIDRAGRWFTGSVAEAYLRGEEIAEDASARGPACLAELALDVVFPMVHGVTGEDGALQGLCQLLDLAYVGGDPLNQSLCWDKITGRMLCVQNDIPQPDFVVLDRDQDRDEQVRMVVERLSWPVFVKPSRTGSSIGVARVLDTDQLREAVTRAFDYDERVIAEQGLDALEIEISGLGGARPRLSIPARIIPARDFYDFEEKYLGNATQFQIPAQISEAQLARLQEIAYRAWTLFRCHGMARIDFLVTADEAYLNEINTIPGFTSISMYPLLLEKSGIDPVSLMRELVDLAQRRHREGVGSREFHTHKDWYKGD